MLVVLLRLVDVHGIFLLFSSEMNAQNPPSHLCFPFFSPPVLLYFFSLYIKEQNSLELQLTVEETYSCFQFFYSTFRFVDILSSKNSI